MNPNQTFSDERILALYRTMQIIRQTEEELAHQGEVLSMSVPGLIDRAARADGDEPHSGFDQTPRGQQALTKVRQTSELASLDRTVRAIRQAIAFAHGSGLFTEIKRAAGLVRLQQREGFVVVRLHVREGRRPARIVDRFEQGAALLHSPGRALPRERQPRQFVFGIARIAGNERIEGCS